MSHHIMDQTLSMISETDAKVIILDITGVGQIDEKTAKHMIKITKATKLMGAECILSGISTEVAQILVHIGMDLSEMITKPLLKDSLAVAFDILGFGVYPKRERAVGDD